MNDANMEKGRKNIRLSLLYQNLCGAFCKYSMREAAELGREDVAGLRLLLAPQLFDQGHGVGFKNQKMVWICRGLSVSGSHRGTDRCCH